MIFFVIKPNYPHVAFDVNLNNEKKWTSSDYLIYKG